MDGLTMPINAEWTTLTVHQSPMECYVVRPKTAGKYPAILVFMEIFGVNNHIQSVTERVAGQGYIALAMNYYHRTTTNLDLPYNEQGMTEGRSHKDKTNKTALMSDTQACIDYLKPLSSGKFGSIGFCFGGHVAYLAAMLPEVTATAAFYGGGIGKFCPGESFATVDLTPKIHGEILCFYGGKDPLITQEETQLVEKALIKADVQHKVVRYPEAGHGFFCDQRQDYNPAAATDAWDQTLELYQRRLS